MQEPFKAKDIITEAVNRVADHFTQHNRGDVVSWPVIERLAGFPRYSQHWSAFRRRFLQKLRKERGITLQAIPGTGWKIETATEQLHDRSIRRQRRSLRQMKLDVLELKCLPDRELTTHQRQIKYRKIDQGATSRRAVLYSLRLAHKLSKPTTNGIPQRRPVAATK